MIHHKVTDIFKASRGARALPDGHYVAFALGSDSHHSEVVVSINGARYLVEAGAVCVMPSGGVRGRPIVEPIRATFHAVEDDASEVGVAHVLNTHESRAHVLGYQCVAELAAGAPALHPIRCTTGTIAYNGAMALIYVVPFCGRQRAVINLVGDAGTTVQIRGVHYSDAALATDYDGTFDVIADNPTRRSATLWSDTGASGIAKVIENENFDALELWAGDGVDATAFTIQTEVR